MIYIPVYGYKEFYNQDNTDDPFKFISKYPSKYLIKCIALINAILYVKKEIRNEEKILQEVFHFNQVKINSLLDRLNSLNNLGIIFSTPHLSILLKDIFRNYNSSEDDNLDCNDFYENLFKTILIYNNLYNNILEKIHLNCFEDLFKIENLSQKYIRSTDFVVTFLKFSLVCSFLKENSNYHPIVNEYVSKFEIGELWNIANYLKDLFVQQKEDSNKIFLNKRSIPPKFLENWLINNYIKDKAEITLNFEMIPHPLYEYDKDTLLIFDFDFFKFSLDQGVFYNLYNNSDETKRIIFNDFKSKLAKDFFEDFMCDKLLFKIFNNRKTVRYKDEEFQDFYIQINKKDLIIIECKMSDIHGQTLENFDFAKFKDAIKKNLASQESNCTRRKGIYQLLHQIENLTKEINNSKILKKFNINKTKNLNIYPILLVSDVNYNIGGVNNFINQEFKVSEEVKSKFNKIYPVIIINIDVLINYYDIFKRDNTTFVKYLKKYLTYIQKKHKHFIRNPQCKISYMKSSFSFDHYLLNSVNTDETLSFIETFISDFSEELEGILEIEK